MIKKLSFFGVIVLAMFFVSGCGPSSKLSIGERKQITNDMEKETLEKLYEQQPVTKKRVRQAVGYAVFASGNINVIFISAGSGYGVVTDNSTGKRTYMKMALGGVGLGLGVKDYRQVLIFHTEDALSKFIYSGWEFGGHADAAAKAGDSGGELSGEGIIGSGIESYSMTESGLALQATIAGSKYWRDTDLN